MADLSAEDREALDQVYISHLKKEIERLRDVAQAEAPSLNREGREHPSYDNPLDPFASPDRLPEQSAGNEVDELERRCRFHCRARHRRHSRR